MERSVKELGNRGGIEVNAVVVVDHGDWSVCSSDLIQVLKLCAVCQRRAVIPSPRCEHRATFLC